MKVRVSILTPKRVVQEGGWKLITGTSKMPKNAFPVGSNYPVTFARNWHWRVDGLIDDATGTTFRLLTAFNAHIENFAHGSQSIMRKVRHFSRDMSFMAHILAGTATRLAMKSKQAI
jgi:hypothetical protein